MAKVQTTADASVLTTDAGFRAWGTVVNAAIAASGMVQTSDTGQINWTTVTAPSTTGTSAGYEIWRFNDTLQSTSPVFVRIEYRYGSGTTNQCITLWFIVGTGSNGSGTINGLTTGVAFMGGPNPNFQTANYSRQPIYACHTAGSFFLVVGNWASAVTDYVSGVISVSRTVDTTGALTSDGVYVWSLTGSSATQPFHGFIDYTNSATQSLSTASTANFPAAAPTLGLLNYDGQNKSYVLPHYCHPTALSPGIVVGILTTRTSGSTYGGLAPVQTFITKPAGPNSSVSHTYILLADSSATTSNPFRSAGPNSLQGSTTAVVDSSTPGWTGVAFLWE